MQVNPEVLSFIASSVRKSQPTSGTVKRPKETNSRSPERSSFRRIERKRFHTSSSRKKLKLQINVHSPEVVAKLVGNVRQF